MSSRNKGIICIILAAFFFALMALFVRLSGDVPSMQKMFFRNIVAFTVAFAAMIKKREKIELNRGDIGFLTLRSIFGTIGIVGNFYAIDYLVLSDASMLNKLSPFFAILFSFIILKEKFTIKQFAAVAIAFIGAMFIIKPTGNMNIIPALAGAAGGMCAGAAYTFVRLLGKRGVKGEIVIAFFSGFSCIVSVPYILMNYTPMTLNQLILLLCAGLTAAGGQFAITKAYFYAPAREISIYDYSQIIFSALLGFIMLGQIPDIYSVAGYVIICSMAVWMFMGNRKAA